MADSGSERFSRRNAIKRMGGAVLGGMVGNIAAAEETRPRFSSLDRVEFNVSDLNRSVGFYARVFGNNDVYRHKRVDKRYFRIGPAYLGMDTSKPPLRIDHYCVGIAGFDMAVLHRFLEQQGVAYKDYPSGRDTAFLDPDGLRTQLSTENSWSNLFPNSVEPVAVRIDGEPIFRPTGLDHVLLNVSDPETSAAFYAKVFGPVSQRNNHRIWFQVGKSRVGLLKTPEGARAGVNHYCVVAERFDYAEVVKRLEEAGAKVESPEIVGAPEFRDPDGFLIQVTQAR